MTDVQVTSNGIHLTGKAIAAIVGILASAITWTGSELFKAGASFATMNASHTKLIEHSVKTDERLTSIETAIKQLDPKALVDRCLAEMRDRKMSIDCYPFAGQRGRLTCNLPKERHQ